MAKLVEVHGTGFVREDPGNLALRESCKLAQKGLHFGGDLNCKVVILSHTSRCWGGKDKNGSAGQNIEARGAF